MVFRYQCVSRSSLVLEDISSNNIQYLLARLYKLWEARRLQLCYSWYSRTEIVVAFSVVQLFSFLVIIF